MVTYKQATIEEPSNENTIKTPKDHGFPENCN
jgi:hypothetical protein